MLEGRRRAERERKYDFFVLCRAPSGSDPSVDCTDRMVIRQMRMDPILSVHPRMVRYNYVMGAVAPGSADCCP